MAARTLLDLLRSNASRVVDSESEESRMSADNKETQEEHQVFAKWDGWCTSCRRSYEEGETIGWTPGKKGARCSLCLHQEGLLEVHLVARSKWPLL